MTGHTPSCSSLRGIRVEIQQRAKSIEADIVVNLISSEGDLRKALHATLKLFMPHSSSSCHTQALHATLKLTFPHVPTLCSLIARSSTVPPPSTVAR